MQIETGCYLDNVRALIPFQGLGILVFVPDFS